MSLADHDRYELFCGACDAASNIMRTLALLLLLASCQSRPDGSSPSAGAKVIETHDDDFLQTRAGFEQRMRARLERVDTRINELGSDASVHLRAERERLAAAIDEIDEQGETAWDGFRAGVERAFDSVERELEGH